MKTKSLFLLPLMVMLFSCQRESFNDFEVNETSELSGTHLKSTAYTPGGYIKVWEDQFDGASIDTNNWVVASLRDPVSGDLVPGAHGDHLLNTAYAGYITEEDTYVENGSLIVRNQKRAYQGTSPAGNYSYTCGWVMSMHRVYMNKGYIEMKARFPSGDKVWPAFWLIAEDLQWGPEWDIMEYFGWKNNSVGYDAMGMHLCYDLYPDTKWTTDWINSYDATYDCEAWHVYGFEWTENYAIWYIDGNPVRTLNAAAISTWPDEDMYIVLNNGQKTDSPDNNTVWPNYFEIDYVSIYERSTQAPLITNGGFESGSVDPWMNYGIASVVQTEVYSGNYSAYIGADNSGLEYSLSNLKPNTTYQFSAAVKSSNSTNVNICVKNYGDSQVEQSTNSNTYTPLSLTFTTGTSNTSAVLAFYKWGSGAGHGWGDDFELIEVVEQPNLLSNGGFEDGVVNPWNKYGTSSIVSDNQNTGSYCAYIGADNSGYKCTVNNLQPNTSYTFSGFVKSSNSNNVNICVKNYGGSQLTQSTNSDAYTPLSITFTTGAGNTSAVIAFYKWGSGTGQGWGDDFELVQGN